MSTVILKKSNVVKLLKSQQKLCFYCRNIVLVCIYILHPPSQILKVLVSIRLEWMCYQYLDILNDVKLKICLFAMLCGGFWLWTWRISGECIAKRLKVPKGQKLKLFSIRGQYFESDQLKILISFIFGFNGDNWDFLGSKCIPKHSITNLIIKNFASSNMKKNLC